MNPILRNVLAVIAGLVAGNVVNMGLIMISGNIIPPPEGVNPESMESLKESMHLFQAKHFIMPFLAHAFGSLIGGFVAVLLANSFKLQLALFIGFLFMIGGVYMVFVLPSPAWFTALDLGVAYIPMAWLGYKMAEKIKA